MARHFRWVRRGLAQRQRDPRLDKGQGDKPKRRYDRGLLVRTILCHHGGQAVTIPDRQTELDRFIAQHFRKPAREAKSNGSAYRFKPSPPRSDDEVLRACRAAKNAAKFSDLYDHGDVDRYHAGDDSSADAGLMEILAFQTQDEDQLEYLFSQSALGQREKWNKRPDYRRRTINYVLGELSDTWQPHGSDGTRLVVDGSSKTEPQDEVRSRSQSLGNEVVSSEPEQ